MNEIFCELQVASCQVCVWQLQQFCCQPEVWHRRKVSPRLEKEDWQHKVSAENQMCRSWQEVPVAWARKKVVEWVEENRKSGLAMTRNLIRLHAKKTAQQMNIDNFLVSSGWCTRFMKRNKLMLRQKTKISQRLPDDLEEKITSFQSFVIRARRSKNYSLLF